MDCSSVAMRRTVPSPRSSTVRVYWVGPESQSARLVLKWCTAVPGRRPRIPGRTRRIRKCKGGKPVNGPVDERIPSRHSRVTHIVGAVIDHHPAMGESVGYEILPPHRRRKTAGGVNGSRPGCREQRQPARSLGTASVHFRRVRRQKHKGIGVAARLRPVHDPHDVGIHPLRARRTEAAVPAKMDRRVERRRSPTGRRGSAARRPFSNGTTPTARISFPSKHPHPA